MWRSFFFAVGLCLVLLGIESLAIDKVVLSAKDKPPQRGMSPVFAPQTSRDIKPPNWAPWSLLGSGAVTMLYSTAIKRSEGK